MLASRFVRRPAQLPRGLQNCRDNRAPWTRALNYAVTSRVARERAAGKRRPAKAGTSTALGFVAFQSVQNATFKAGTAWLDPAESPEPVKEALPADPQASFS